MSDAVVTGLFAIAGVLLGFFCSAWLNHMQQKIVEKSMLQAEIRSKRASANEELITVLDSIISCFYGDFDSAKQNAAIEQFDTCVSRLMLYTSHDVEKISMRLISERNSTPISQMKNNPHIKKLRSELIAQIRKEMDIPS